MEQKRSRTRALLEQGRETFRRVRSEPPPAAVPGSFVALTCNVGNGLADPGQLTRFLARSNADIVGLQELAGPQAEAIERDLADEYPHRLLFPGGFAGKGLLSKVPVEERAVVAFNPDRPDLNATVLIEDRPLRVIVAHPKPPRLTRSGLLFDDVTEHQVRQVGQLAMRERPSIVLCDLNTISLQTAYMQLLAAGLRDPFRYAGRWAATFPVRVGNTHRFGTRADKWKLKPVLRIDYVLHTDELIASEVDVGEDIGSDHLPVFARLAWQEDAEAAQ